MEAIELLEYLQDIIENSSKFIVPGKVVINKNEVMDVIDRIICLLPDEFKKAKWLCAEKDRILEEAIQEAEQLKKDKLNEFKNKIENHSITKNAQDKADAIILNAERTSKELKINAIDYADYLLNDLENEIDEQGKEMLENIQKEMQEFLINVSSQIENKNKTIRGSIKELRNTK